MLIVIWCFGILDEVWINNRLSFNLETSWDLLFIRLMNLSEVWLMSLNCDGWVFAFVLLNGISKYWWNFFLTLKIGQNMPNRGTYITIEWQAYPQIIGDALLLLLLSYIVVLLLAYGLSYHCYYVIELLLLFIWLVVSTLLKHISQLGWWNSQYI